MGRAFTNDNDFLIREPLNQPGVVEDVESGITPTDLLPTPYYADDMVRCAFCAQRQHHRKGYFAVLPGGALALCGHCCAVNFAGLETVQRIDRERARLASSIRNRDRLLPITHGVAELLDAIEPLYWLERKTAEARVYLATVFPRDFDRRQDQYISRGRGGLVAIMRQEGKSLTDAQIAEWREIRESALNLIRIGLDELPRRCADVSPRSIRKRIGELMQSHPNWKLSFRNDSIWLRDQRRDGWVGANSPERLMVSDLHAPDLAPVKELLTRIRSEAG